MLNARIDRALRTAAQPVLRLAMKPSVRGSTWFRAAQQIALPTPQEGALADAMAYVAGSRLGGSYIEFGVSRGTMLAFAFHAAERNGLREMRFYGFDSFEGMPPPTGAEALLAGEQHEKGAFQDDLPEFNRVMADNRVDLSRIDVMPGWFEDVLTPGTKAKLGPAPAAVVAAKPLLPLLRCTFSFSCPAAPG